MVGSPPRVRGEDKAQNKARRGGITPACAGRSACACSCRGSPPRVRGEEIPKQEGTLRDRITPACAGRRLCNSEAVRLVEDHPRVCGEKGAARRSEPLTKGSPPRVRGEAIRPGRCCASPGITPACAGRSSPSTRYIRATRDHPRVCGEKAQRGNCTRKRGGSPPRVRGEARRRLPVLRSVRITPACAGRRLCRSGL